MEDFFVENADAPHPELADQYFLPASGGPLVLDAAKGFENENLTYSWSGADGFQSTFSEIKISAPGIFTIKMERDGCISQHEIEVKSLQASIFRKIGLSPNPAPAGKFSLEIALHEPSKVEIEIRDATGRLLKTQAFDGSDFYQKTMQLDAPPGAYFVKIGAGNDSRTVRLVVF